MQHKSKSPRLSPEPSAGGGITMLELSIRTGTELDGIIRRGLATFVEVGEALREMRNAGKFREMGYSSFTAYCVTVGISRPQAYRLMDSADVMAHLSPIGDSLQNEAQAREFVPLLREAPELVAVVQEEAQALHGPAPTADQYKEIVRSTLRTVRQAKAPTVPALSLPASVRLEVGDATRLPWPSESVDLICTSPPYGLEMPYAGGDDSPAAWPALITAMTAEAYRVAAPGGWLAVNVPLDTSKGGPRPTYVRLVTAAEAAGWEYRFTINWHEGNVTSLPIRFLGSPYQRHLFAPVEMIAVFRKGSRVDRADVDADLTWDELREWGQGIWTFNGESRAWEGHPAPFPVELPRRLIKLLSYPGDVVADPFVGSGTTPLAAYELGRVAWGVDLSAAYVESARRRLGERLKLAA